jgi:hypothetical protein
MNIIESLNSYLPTYEVVLPFSKKSMSFTPFKVKDIKNLTIVLEEENKKLAFFAMISILKNCVTSNKDEILNLCLADAEYLFLHIRSKSVDEVLNLIVDDEKVKLNINEIQTKNNVNEEVINLSNSISIELKTPTVKDLLNLNLFEKEDFVKACIKKIILKNEIYQINKFVPNELKDVLDNLPISFLTKVDAFIDNQPSLFAKIKLGDDEREVSGMLNFFTYQ